MIEINNFLDPFRSLLMIYISPQLIIRNKTIWIKTNT